MSKKEREALNKEQMEYLHMLNKLTELLARMPAAFFHGTERKKCGQALALLETHTHKFVDEFSKEWREELMENCNCPPGYCQCANGSCVQAGESC